MKAMLLKATAPVEQRPLAMGELPIPVPSDEQILVKVSVCGVCHTDLDEIEGRLTPSRLPIVLGHQVVGTVAAKGKAVSKFALDDRVGITWLYSCCGECSFCRAGNENLCADSLYTGKDVHGGYAEYMVIGADFAHAIPERFTDAQGAPLLCAGVIGYRSFRLGQILPGHTIGIFGFGASAHIVIQIIKHEYPDNRVFVFTRGAEHQRLARELGADWVGGPGDRPGDEIDRGFDFTPVGETVRDALAILRRGGRLVINAIRKTTPVPELSYRDHLWHEKEVKSVANVTRQDAEEFLALAGRIPIEPVVEEFALEQANEALILMKQSRIHAAAVLTVATRASEDAPYRH